MRRTHRLGLLALCACASCHPPVEGAASEACLTEAVGNSPSFGLADEYAQLGKSQGGTFVPFRDGEEVEVVASPTEEVPGSGRFVAPVLILLPTMSAQGCLWVVSASGAHGAIFHGGGSPDSVSDTVFIDVGQDLDSFDGREAVLEAFVYPLTGGEGAHASARVRLVNHEGYLSGR
jgi:hypothetical protein